MGIIEKISQIYNIVMDETQLRNKGDVAAPPLILGMLLSSRGLLLFVPGLLVCRLAESIYVPKVSSLADIKNSKFISGDYASTP
jgi:hypothetical protein